MAALPPGFLEIWRGHIKLGLEGKHQFKALGLTIGDIRFRVVFEKFIAVENQHPVTRFESPADTVVDVAAQTHTISARFFFKWNDRLVVSAERCHAFPGIVGAAVVQDKDSFAEAGCMRQRKRNNIGFIFYDANAVQVINQFIAPSMTDSLNSH